MREGNELKVMKRTAMNEKKMKKDRNSYAR